MSDSGFNYKNYKNLIHTVKTKCEIVATPLPNTNTRHAVWRHDVDISLDDATKMAKIEYDEDISSMYNIMMSSPFYNLFTEDNVSNLHTIIDYNHVLGLHFDPTVYTDKKQSTKNDILSFVTKEKNAIQEITGVNLKTFTLHNPSLISNLLYVYFDTDTIADLININSNTIKTSYEYCSDSNMTEIIEKINYNLKTGTKNIHILTHPIWWSPPSLSKKEKIYYKTKKHMKVQRKYYKNIIKAVKNNECEQNEQ